MSLLLTGRPGKGFRDIALFGPRSAWLLADPELPESAILRRNLLASGFSGRLALDAPPEEPPDLAVVCVAPDAMEDALRRVAEAGCHAAIVPVPAPNLTALARASGLRVLGERSFGLALPHLGLNATLSHIPVPRGRLALMTQSSAVARAVLDWAAAEGLGFSHIIGIGANDDLGFASGLDWLARDSRTALVLLELRRIKNRRGFVSAARATARTRPVLALRPGARLDDPSGVGESVMEAALRRAGVLRAAGLEEWLAAAETLARAKPRGEGDRVAILSNGIGLARLAADAAVAHGLRLAETGVRNPHSLGSSPGTALAEEARRLAALPGVDAVIAVHAPTDEPAPATALVEAARGNRGAPILLGWVGEASAHGERRALTEAGLPVFATPEAAIRGAVHLARERRNRAAAAELPPAELLEIAPERDAVRSILDGARAEGRDRLFEDEALFVLAAYGIATAPGRVARDAEEAAQVAAAMGFPVVLKARALLRFKSEAGGVVTGLRGEAALRAAANSMTEEVARRAPGTELAGFLVQRQMPRGSMELRLRLDEDPMWGPWIGFGQGGTAADLAQDEAFDLPPLNLPLAHALIARTRLARLLPGFRDRPPVLEPAIADALVRLSQLAVDFPVIARVVVNPVFADAAGAVAADAAITLRPEGEAALLAIQPYPAHLESDWVARDGRRFRIRPIRPEDAEAQGKLFRALPPEDVRFRFFSSMRELPPALLARLTQIDYDREMAFVAQSDGATHGTARLIREPGGEAAEFAVVVAPSAKGTGLARHLMERAIEWGRAKGLRELTGHILADNAPMLAFARRLGFTLSRSEEDVEVMLASKRLDTP
ncbi:bifunctional acetate--CoA ligase family protein/GNAT family N-acetyltransferase [Sabulicella glaciei]|uniref:GNAT family N-acetyltransferase n=1 Tax=Sabulicella glaciei TaxID=2984948 RepID=A0ABT3NT24_9PROT|nr:GNAT family N-acetyltransferase [Roseococcus sp. MDT2-1-1]MCW8085306.1 GNAT family N-acetyltransferase [Roseococcus sp. MDT2-1-1]